LRRSALGSASEHYPICLVQLLRPRRPTLFPYTTLFRSSLAQGGTKGANWKPAKFSSVMAKNWRQASFAYTRLPTRSVIATRSVVDRKSTRLNSSHVKISYAVFCLKKKRDAWNVPAGHTK